MCLQTSVRNVVIEISAIKRSLFNGGASRNSMKLGNVALYSENVSTNPRIANNRTISVEFVVELGRYSEGMTTISATNIPRNAAPVMRAITVRSLQTGQADALPSLCSNLIPPRWTDASFWPHLCRHSDIHSSHRNTKYPEKGKIVAELVRLCIIGSANFRRSRSTYYI